LFIPSFPVGVLGLVSLPWTGGDKALWPLLILGALTFGATTLLVPVSTTWGTFLHAAGPVHVLLIVSCLVGLDLLIARVGRSRGRTSHPPRSSTSPAGSGRASSSSARRTMAAGRRSTTRAVPTRRASRRWRSGRRRTRPMRTRSATPVSSG